MVELPKECPIQEICKYFVIPDDLARLYPWEQEQLWTDYQIRSSINFAKCGVCLGNNSNLCSLVPTVREKFLDKLEEERIDWGGAMSA